VADPLSALPWPELLRRLQGDFKARESSSSTRDESAWSEVRRRIREYAEQTLAGRWAAYDVDVEDIVQSVLLKLQDPQVLVRLQAVKFHAGYFVVMVRNAAADSARRRKLELESAATLERAVVESGQVYQHLIHRQDWQVLLRELGRLTPSEKSLIHMRFWQDLRISEIAGALELPYSRVAVRLFRLLRKLERRMVAADPRDPM
jgi:RNA polymerase sigma factor (sigma-70 family)